MARLVFVTLVLLLSAYGCSHKNSSAMNDAPGQSTAASVGVS
jgi:hypothetical protein